MTSLGPEGTLCYHMCWGCVWYVGVCFCRVACLLLAVRAQLSQNSWRRFLRDLADSWRIRAAVFGTIFKPFSITFWHNFEPLGRHLGIPGSWGTLCNKSCQKKFQMEGLGCRYGTPFWRPFWSIFASGAAFLESVFYTSFWRGFGHLKIAKKHPKNFQNAGQKGAKK